jgi:hypothetical protein
MGVLTVGLVEFHGAADDIDEVVFEDLAEAPGAYGVGGTR